MIESDDKLLATGKDWILTRNTPRQFFSALCLTLVRLESSKERLKIAMSSHTKFLAIAFSLCAVPVLASADDFPLKEVPQLTRLVDYEASWSPEGRSIVLISNRHGGLKVHVLDPNSERGGSDMRQISSGSDEDDSPAWSPDGRQIAFVCIHGGVSNICVMKPDGSDVRQVTRGLGQNIHPMWSPDGSRILFNTTYFASPTRSDEKAIDEKAIHEKRIIGETRDNYIDLATIRPDGGDLRRITYGGGYTYASFSPDGLSILHRRQQGQDSQVFLMNADGTGDHNLSGPGTIDGWPAWSPDGSKIVFSRHGEHGFQVFEMNRDGTGIRQLTDAPGDFVNPRWSPDGNKILCGRRLGSISLILFAAPN